MAAPTTQSIQRFVRGPIEVVDAPAASGQQINVGDLCCFFSGLAFPASAYPINSGSEVQTWSGLRNNFLGVSLSQFNSFSTVSGSIRAAVEGIFHFPFPNATSGNTLSPGTFVNATMVQNSGYYNPQQLMQCSGQATGIGKIVDQFAIVASGVAEVNVYLQGVVPMGGIAN